MPFLCAAATQWWGFIGSSLLKNAYINKWTGRRYFGSREGVQRVDEY